VDNATGLLGWVSCIYGDLHLDGITLRRTASGVLTISFPERRDRAGRSHPVVRPIDARARTAIETEILQGLSGARESRP
jgi:DNA-binding cell septation regulator SpoVG